MHLYALRTPFRAFHVTHDLFALSQKYFVIQKIQTQQLFNYFTNNNIIESARKKLKNFDDGSDTTESKARSLRGKQRSLKFLNLTPIPAIGSTSKINHSHTVKK